MENVKKSEENDRGIISLSLSPYVQNRVKVQLKPFALEFWIEQLKKTSDETKKKCWLAFPILLLCVAFIYIFFFVKNRSRVRCAA